MSKPRQSLPIDQHLNQIIRTLENANAIVIQAEPGTGKTTRIPPALLNSKFCSDGEILVLEPRRLAAKLSAQRVADEMGELVGETVGYHFRFERKTSSRTRITFLTEGMFMKRLLGDPELKKVRVVVLDEFHERNLQGDLALACVRNLQKNSRPELRIVVMSATLDTQTVSQFLECESLQLPGSRHPIQIEYAPDVRVSKAVENLLTREDSNSFGDVLVFLPGKAEIHRAIEDLAPLSRTLGFEALALHGELTRKEQDRAILSSHQRKVILATNVAETSLTIPGVNQVIDSGLARQASYSFWSGLPALKTRSISKASATQRAGRAGRTGPGRVIRLYSKGDYEGRASFEIAEVQRVDLAQAVLELKRLRMGDILKMDWFEKPKQNSLESTLSLLRLLGCLDPKNELTPMGARTSEFPVHPRLGALLIAGESLGVFEDSLQLTVGLSEGLLRGLDLLSALSASRISTESRLSLQLRAFFEKSSTARAIKPHALAQAVLMAFSDRVAKLRASSGPVRELVFCRGGTAEVQDSPLLTRSDSGESYFVVADAQETQRQGELKSRLRAQSLVKIEPDWLLDYPNELLQDKDETEWDSARKKVIQKTQLSYGQLVLSQSEAPAQPSQKASQILAQKILELRLIQPEALQGIKSRMKMYSQHFKETDLSEAQSNEWWLRGLEIVCESRTSLAELEGIDLISAAIESQMPGLSQKIQKALPSHFNFKTSAGKTRNVEIHYEENQPPWIESRLQDFFGMSVGPTLAQGRISLILHLLAPNYRAVQVTSDLAGFWKRGYLEVKKELSRRYPRHHWPENPLEPFSEDSSN